MSKVMSMQEAISKYVKPGNVLFIGGMQHGEPSAAVHEIIRQRIDHLTLVSMLVATADILIGEGCIDKVVTGYIMQDVKRCHWLGKAKAMNRLPVFEEYSHFGVSLALLAGQMGIPFVPTRSQIGSDLPKRNPNIKVIPDPYGGEDVGAIKAIIPDVGILHVQRSDAEGNAQRWGSMGIDAEGINASRAVIITTEKIVESDVIRRDPNRTIIPGFRVSAVVEQPWGAYPMHLAGCYTSDSGAFNLEISTPEGYETYLKRLVYGVTNWDEYLKEREAIKGPGYFDKLRIQAVSSDPILTGYKRLER
jgi:glutaconate CoA-transferase, subunit A